MALLKGDTEASAPPLLEQWPNLRFLGMGAWWAWIWLSYNSLVLMRMFPVEQQTGYVLLMYLCSTIGIAVSMLAAAVFWKKATPLVDRTLFVIAFGIVAGISTVLLGCSPIMGAGAFFVIAAVLTGVGTSVLCLKVGRVYGSVSLGESLISGGLSLLLAMMLYFVGVGIPEGWTLPYLAALPLISALMLTMRSDELYPGDSLAPGEGDERLGVERNIFARLVVAAALVAFTAGVGRGVSSIIGDYAAFSQEGAIIIFFIGVLGVVIVVCMNRFSVRRAARRVYAGLIVLGVALMLASCFSFNIAYLSIGKEALWVVMSCFMAYLAFRFELSPVRVFGIGQAAYFFASTAGWAVGSFVAPYYDDAVCRMAVGIAMAFMVVLVFVYIFPEWAVKRITESSAMLRPLGSRHAHGTPGALAVRPEADGPGHEGSDRARAEADGDEENASGQEPGAKGLDRAAESQYGLSQRELEILDLFAQGRSATWIADYLMISKNTVRSHLRSVYTKLDVHTRQELLDFLNGDA